MFRKELFENLFRKLIKPWKDFFLKKIKAFVKEKREIVPNF